MVCYGGRGLLGDLLNEAPGRVPCRRTARRRQWRNDGVAAASSDGAPLIGGPPTKREKARGGPDLRK